MGKHRHDSSDSDSDSDRPKKKKHKDKDKKEKALAKMMESEEEKRKRRLDKKAKKQSKKLAQQKDDTGYTNQDNPWNDANLTDKFLWRKKSEKDTREGRVASVQSDNRRVLKEELKKVKEAREQREVEKEKWEEERRMMEKEIAGLEYMDWEKKEDKFHLEQAKVRADIRLKEGRGKAIDLLSRNLHMNEKIGHDGFELEVQEPCEVFKGLHEGEMMELKGDIQTQLQLDEEQQDFWSAMMVVCEDEQQKLRLRAGGGHLGGAQSGVHSSVNDDISQMLSGKTVAEMDALKVQISSRLETGAVMDVEYWETVLKKLTVHRAKAKLKEVHEQLLSTRLVMVRDAPAPPPATATTSSSTATATVPRSSADADDEDAVDFEPDEDEEVEVPHVAEPEEEQNCPWAPVLISNPGDEDWITEESDKMQIELARRQVIEAKKNGGRARSAPGAGSSAQAGAELDSSRASRWMFDEESRQPMEQGEARFSVEAPLANKTFWEHDKFRPRKPRYFNRVHTGYEWNKYNQTHYDHDNPPPKTVQGYKFNIFYPDLFDKQKAPEYKLTKDPDGDGDTCLLLFSAGPPYEDIAFRIVNREWEYSHKRGFKCRFERGVLQLYFNFQRYRYRR